MIPQNFIQMIQAQCSSSASSSTKGSTGNGGEIGFNAIFKRVLNEKSVSVSSISDEMGIDPSALDINNIFDQLKKIVLTKGESLENMLVGEDALDDLKNILSEMGFEQNAVEGFFENLKLETGEKEIPLSDLFTRLEESEWFENTEDRNFLEISMLPHLEIVLSDIGLEPDEITSVISDAKIEGTGIDLNVLLKNLKVLRESGWAPNESFQQIVKTNENDNQNSGLKDVLVRLGVSDQNGKNEEVVTLDDIIKGLQTVTEEPEVPSFNGSILKNDIERFLGKIKVEKKPSSFSLSIELSEEKLKTDWIRGGEENNKTGIFDRLFEDAFPQNNTEVEELSEDSDFIDDTFVSNLLNKGNKKIHTEVLPHRNPSEKVSDSQPALGNKNSDSVFSMENLVKDLNSTDKQVGAMKEMPTQKTLPSYVLNQVGRQVFRSINNGENEVRFQIKPPQLGRVQMAIDNSPEGFKISIIAEQTATKDLILAHSSELKAMMANQGLRVDMINVDVSSDFQQAMSDTSHQEDGSKKRKGKGGDSVDEIDYAGIIDGDLDVASLSHRSGVLDLLI